MSIVKPIQGLRARGLPIIGRHPGKPFHAGGGEGGGGSITNANLEAMFLSSTFGDWFDETCHITDGVPAHNLVSLYGLRQSSALLTNRWQASGWPWLMYPYPYIPTAILDATYGRVLNLNGAFIWMNGVYIAPGALTLVFRVKLPNGGTNGTFTLFGQDNSPWSNWCWLVRSASGWSVQWGATGSSLESSPVVISNTFDNQWVTIGIRISDTTWELYLNDSTTPVRTLIDQPATTAFNRTFFGSHGGLTSDLVVPRLLMAAQTFSNADFQKIMQWAGQTP